MKPVNFLNTWGNIYCPITEAQYIVLIHGAQPSLGNFLTDIFSRKDLTLSIGIQKPQINWPRWYFYFRIHNHMISMIEALYATSIRKLHKNNTFKVNRRVLAPLWLVISSGFLLIKISENNFSMRWWSGYNIWKPSKLYKLLNGKKPLGWLNQKSLSRKIIVVINNKNKTNASMNVLSEQCEKCNHPEYLGITIS